MQTPHLYHQNSDFHCSQIAPFLCPIFKFEIPQYAQCAFLGRKEDKRNSPWTMFSSSVLK